ncbi:hypothetical protein [Jiulongibacter sp. NS-SX5]|uniref:hypothetical protein n=1 Tax=Jiulongibacter sp. NS-SX5 TaxID=3463854 RepID=UPI004058CC20
MTSKVILEELRLSFKREAEFTSLEKALHSLIAVFDLGHPNFDGFLFRDSSPNTLTLTTEGKFGPDEKQKIRVPYNVLDFPLNSSAHLLFHEFFHIQQRETKTLSISRPQREFEAYLEGLTSPRRPKINLPKSLRTQFIEALHKYYNQMDEQLKMKYKSQMELVESAV